ncbi:hypothetical protein ACFWVB_37075 [Streptomyces microflavus]|uniref:hypothetical protein n=1 Tax=Streptomyces microflavus TaxID=1919 RepID=UPI00366569E0
MNMSRHAARIAALGAACALGSLGLSPASAAPSSALVECTGQSVSQYSPPLTNTPQATTIVNQGRLGLAASPGLCVGAGTTVLSAQYDETINNPSQSCNTPPSTGSGTRIFTWDNGQTSSFAYTSTLTVINGTSASVRTGTITAGRFSGHQAEQITLFPTLDPTACATTGVATASSQTTLTIQP